MMIILVAIFKLVFDVTYQVFVFHVDSRLIEEARRCFGAKRDQSLDR